MNPNQDKDHGAPGNATEIDRLITLMDCLRDAEYGCQWDRRQTMESLTAHTLEEVYEVVDAVEQGDWQQIRDELGDLLFQVVFYARIASEEGHYDIQDIARSVVDKLLRRHPHVFPDATLESFGRPTRLTPEEVESNWEAIKNSERRSGAGDRPVSVLDDVPRALPAIERSAKLQKRAASLGFDWSDSDAVLDKVREEIGELEQARSHNDGDAIEAELGDLLFSCVNLARHLGVKPETALRKANRRFEGRFRDVEQSVSADGDAMQNMALEELEAYWQAAKNRRQG